MQGAIVLLAVLVAVGLLLFYFDRRKPHHGHAPAEPKPEQSASSEPQPQQEQACCGLHAICEKKYATPASERPVYYDDEELDVLADRNPDTYTNAEREMLRDVVLTLRPDDAWGWSHSLELRHIELPPDIRDELLLLLESKS